MRRISVASNAMQTCNANNALGSLAAFVFDKCGFFVFMRIYIM